MSHPRGRAVSWSRRPPSVSGEGSWEGPCRTRQSRGGPQERERDPPCREELGSLWVSSEQVPEAAMRLEEHLKLRSK